VSRWHQRLAELRGAHAVAADLAHDFAVDGVQNVQNVQNIAARPIFEHSEQIEQPTAAAEPLPSATKHTAANCSDGEEERAAIFEYDGEVPRAWAEGFSRVQRDRPPGRVPLNRWQGVIDSIEMFLDRWASRAAALGWEATDIFGADADRPEVTWLNSGPLWHGDGACVVEVHADRMILATKGGAKQTAFRRAHLRPRLASWEFIS
jgi:hypothetical protein